MIEDDVDVERYGERVRAEAQAHAHRRNEMSGWVLHSERGSED